MLLSKTLRASDPMGGATQAVIGIFARSVTAMASHAYLG